MDLTRHSECTGREGQPCCRTGFEWVWRCIGSVAILAFFACGGPSVQAADPYASALDQRFASESAAQANARIASLEDGLRAQVQQMSRPATADSTSVEEAVDSGFIWEMVMVFAGGLVGLIFLRSWHKTLFQPPKSTKTPAVGNAEDAAMAELGQALQPGLVNSPGPTSASSTTEAAAASPTPGPAAAPISETIASLKESFQKLARVEGDTQRLEVMKGLSEQVTKVKEGSGLTGLRSIWLLASALQGLLKQFVAKTSNITPSALRTAAAAIDLLEFLSTRTVRADIATDPPVRLLAVDDEPISRRAVALALKKVFNEPDIAPDGPHALTLAAQTAYDVVFLDIEMPGMDGFEVCTKTHEMERNKTTPVVFVTSHSDFESRAKSVIAGANDLMAKPFLASEIALKALTLVVRRRAERESLAFLEDNSVRPALAPAREPAEKLCAAVS